MNASDVPGGVLVDVMEQFLGPFGYGQPERLSVVVAQWDRSGRAHPLELEGYPPLLVRKALGRRAVSQLCPWPVPVV